MRAPSPRLIAELVVNLALPWAVYALAEPRGGEFLGLLASSAPPLLWSLWELRERRSVDLLSLFVLAGIALSLIGVALGGSPRLMLLRESLLSGLTGLVFLVSLAFPKPLIFHLARAAQARRSDGEAGKLSELWGQAPCRRAFRLMTAVWGLGLSGEALLRTWFAWHWPIPRFLAVTPLISYGLFGAIALWSFWFGRRLAQRR